MYSAFGCGSMTAGHAPQASSATRHGGSLAKNVIILFRPSRFYMTILPSASSPVNLKDALGDIEPNRDSVHEGRSPRWVFTRKLGAADAVGGRPPSIARSHWGAESRPSFRTRYGRRETPVIVRSEATKQSRSHWAPYGLLDRRVPADQARGPSR